MDSGGTLTLLFSADGTAPAYSFVISFTDGTVKWVRATRGAVVSGVISLYSSDDGVNWTP